MSLKGSLDDLIGDLDPVVHGLTTALVGLSGPRHLIDDGGKLNGTAKQAKVHHGVLCKCVYCVCVCVLCVYVLWGVVETGEGVRRVFLFFFFFLSVCVYVCMCMQYVVYML